MPIIAQKMDIILNEKNLTRYELGKFLKTNLQNFYHMINGERAFTEKVIKKLLPILEVSKEEFESWVLADKYPKEIIERAIQIKKCHSELVSESIQTRKTLKQVQGDNKKKSKKKCILTFNIDKILEEKEISRTALAKQIGHSQTGLNSVIRGQVGISKSLLEKLSQALEVPQDEILSWSIADKYKLDLLEQVLDLI